MCLVCSSRILPKEKETMLTSLSLPVSAGSEEEVSLVKEAETRPRLRLLWVAVFAQALLGLRKKLSNW